MPDLRTAALVSLTAVLIFGTSYSATYSTYLDTSNPLLTHLPHPLHETHYFASKKNPLNTIFIKRAWAWTSAAFVALFITSPPSSRTIDRVLKYLVQTLSWMAFTSWFFGPALIERVIIASGGECILALPGGDTIGVPAQYCYSRSTLSPETHPTLFSTADNPVVVTTNESWHATPRLRRGHDVSGHIFLLTMSIMFLADQLRSSLRSRERWSDAHKGAVLGNIALILVWMFASYTTSVYFHSPFEKFTGYVLGLACFALSQSRFISRAPVLMSTSHTSAPAKNVAIVSGEEKRTS